jgi:hypothetical protein
MSAARHPKPRKDQTNTPTALDNQPSFIETRRRRGVGSSSRSRFRVRPSTRALLARDPQSRKIDRNRLIRPGVARRPAPRLLPLGDCPWLPVLRIPIGDTLRVHASVVLMERASHSTLGGAARVPFCSSSTPIAIGSDKRPLVLLCHARRLVGEVTCCGRRIDPFARSNT